MENSQIDYRKWWNYKSEDEQIWLMMKHGFSNPFDPNRVKISEIEKMYKIEEK